MKHRKKLEAACLQGTQRLNRVLAASGLGSRREVEQYIVEGRVEIDGDICTDLAKRVDPGEQSILVDGQAIRAGKATYFAVHKPAGVVCTNRDPHGRTRLIDIVPNAQRLFPIGRLDRSSTGLIVLTNDGELAQRLAHPKFGVTKTYFVVVQGKLGNAEIAKLQKGIYLAEGVARVEHVKIRRQKRNVTELDMVLREGKNREIRRVLARLGNKVLVLRRTAIGDLRLGQLPLGAYRPLTQQEVESLYAESKPESRRKKKNQKDSSKSRGAEQKPGKSKKAATSSSMRTDSSAQRTGAGTGNASAQSAAPKSETPRQAESNRTAEEITPQSVEVDSGWDDWDTTPSFLAKGGVIDYEVDVQITGDMEIDDLAEEEFEEDDFESEETRESGTRTPFNRDAGSRAGSQNSNDRRERRGRPGEMRGRYATSARSGKSKPDSTRRSNRSQTKSAGERSETGRSSRSERDSTSRSESGRPSRRPRKGGDSMSDNRAGSRSKHRSSRGRQDQSRAATPSAERAATDGGTNRKRPTSNKSQFAKSSRSAKSSAGRRGDSRPGESRRGAGRSKGAAKSGATSGRARKGGGKRRR